MIRISPEMIECINSAIAALCPMIDRQIRSQTTRTHDEYILRRELVFCILASQVRFEMAMKFLNLLENSGLLSDECWQGDQTKSFKTELFYCMSKGYRFPKVRTLHILGARNAIAKRRILSRLHDTCDPIDMRLQWINSVPGLGPKQASMFLRNIGWSYELAILDVHVLRFLAIQALIPDRYLKVGTIKEYEYAERAAIEYAQEIGCPIGYLDWAIWATMKAANELGL